MYNQEKELIEAFESCLTAPSSPFPRLAIATEFDYRNGRVDLVGSSKDGELIAFEVKIFRWRAALHQAYRNSSFAHLSYVVLPKKAAMSALKKQHEFEKRGVGLCTMEDSSIVIEIPCNRRDPIQPWLTESAINFILGEKDVATSGCSERIQE